MSSIAITPGSTGTGVFTIAAPSTSTNRTLTLPDATGTVQTIGGVLTQFNASGSAPVYACRAWVNFNGTGTVAILASGNVSSITDHAAGDYTLNFVTAMPDVNYAFTGVAGNASNSTLGVASPNTSVVGTSSVRMHTVFANGSLFDFDRVYVAIFR
jgi:hypothetical protein